MDEDLVREGERPSESILLLEGFAARYKLLRNGERQITALHIPGDFVDLHSFLLKKMDHGVVALTRCRVGRTKDMSFELPLTQAELGDVLGLSTVHVNRVIQQLRAGGLVTWNEKRIVIADWSHLQEVAEFDPTFLNLENEPR